MQHLKAICLGSVRGCWWALLTCAEARRQRWAIRRMRHAQAHRSGMTLHSAA